MKPIVLILQILSFFVAHVFAKNYVRYEPKKRFVRYELKAASDDKLGMLYFYNSRVNYTTERENVGFEAPSRLQGSGVFYELLVFKRFGINFQYAFQLERNVQLSVGTIMFNLVEKASMTTIDVKTYFSDHRDSWFLFFVGVGAGICNVSSNFTTRTGSGVITEDTTEAAFPVAKVLLGFDVIFASTDSTGIRFETGMMDGGRTNLTSQKNEEFKYNSPFAHFGIFIFF